MSDQSPGAGGASEQLSNDTGTPTRGGGKRGLVIGGVVVAVAVAGGAAWAATSFLGQGAQPAEALPAGTLGYASVDLDPSGGQKIEALKVLRKFPALEKELDLGSGDDLRKKLFEEICASKDLTPSQVVRRLIRQYVQENAGNRTLPEWLKDND